MDKKLNVLIITGVVTSEHDPKMVPMIRYMLKSTGRFNVRVTEEFTGCTAETLEKYDLVFVYYDGKPDVESPYEGWGANAEKVFYDYVKNGGGVVLYHTALMNCGEQAFPEELVKLAGYDYDFSKGMRKSPKLEVIVNTDTQAHEITKGCAKSWMTVQEDFFVNMTPAPESNVTVLATIIDEVADYDPEKTQPHRRAEFAGVDIAALPGMGEQVPVIWTNTYGKGRVFCVSIGHGPDTLRRPNFVGLVCRGAEWAASGEVTIPYPDLSGWNRLRCWPFYEDRTWQQFAEITSF